MGKTPLKISLGALVAILVWCVFLLRKYSLSPTPPLVLVLVVLLLLLLLLPDILLT